MQTITVTITLPDSTVEENPHVELTLRDLVADFVSDLDDENDDWNVQVVSQTNVR